MNLLDKDRHPVRLAVVTSVTGGLILSSILAAGGALFRTGLLAARVPLWLLLAAVAATACVMAVLGAVTHRSAQRTFLVLPAFSQKHWLAQLIKNTHRGLDRSGKSVQLMIPDDDYSVVGQAHHLRNILSRRAEYAGGFVIAADERESPRDLRRFCGKLAKHVVFMDVEPFQDEQDYPAGTAFVGYEPAGIGERAAEWVLHLLAAEVDENPTILVVGGPAQNARHVRFIEVVDHALGHGHVVLAKDGNFARMRARTVVAQKLAELSRTGRKVSVIFCTNDEMALGAVDALHADGSELVNTVTVVGVDGTPEARALIDTGRSPLRATVVQDPYQISEIAVDLFERMLKGEHVPKRTRLPAEIYDGGGVSRLSKVGTC